MVSEPTPLAQAADELVGRTGGDEPPAVPTRSRRGGRRPGAGRPRRDRARDSEPEPTAPAADPLAVDESDIAAAGELARVAWDMVAPFVKVRPLSDEQAAKLGRPAAVLVKKYLPMLGQWQHEIAFALAILAIARENRIVPEPAAEPEILATEISGPHGPERTGEP